MREKVLLLAWLLFMAVATFWLPAYSGTIVASEMLVLVVPYALIAGAAAITVRERCRSAGRAALSTLPTLALLDAALLAGALLNAQQADARGSPLFLYFGVSLWASWAVLVLSTALVSRTRWNSRAGILLGLAVAVLGFLLFTIRTD